MVVVVVGADSDRVTVTVATTPAKTAAATIAGIQWRHQGTWGGGPNGSAGPGTPHSSMSSSNGPVTTAERYRRGLGPGDRPCDAGV